MRLLVLTPEAPVVDGDVAHVRAEDDSGSFGVLPGHANLVTALAISVLAYRSPDGREQFVAVRGGLLTVSGGVRVQVLTREAVTGDDLAALERDVLARFRRSEAAEERARSGAGKLETTLLRRVADYVHVEGSRRAGGAG